MAAWEGFRNKMKAKRVGKKTGNGVSSSGTGSTILQKGEIVVQRLSDQVSGKAQKYTRIGAREFVSYDYAEVTLHNIKECCVKHFKTRFCGSTMQCDVLAGEQGPSCKTLGHIPDLKVIHVRFLKPATVASISQRNIIEEGDDDLFSIPLPPKIQRRGATSQSSASSSHTYVPKLMPIQTVSQAVSVVDKRQAPQPKSLSLTEMLKLGSLLHGTRGTIVHLFKFDIQKLSWTSVPIDVEFFVEDDAFGTGGFREAFRATCSTVGFERNWVVKKYLASAVKAISDLGMDPEQHTKKTVQMHLLAKNFCEQLEEKVHREKAAREYGKFLHYQDIYFGKLGSGECVTIEEYIPGDFKKYMNNTGAICQHDDDPIALKSTNLAHFSYEKSGGKLMVTDIQGSGYTLCDPEIASSNMKDEDDAVLFCAGNLSNFAISCFIHMHECNQFCKLTKLNALENIG